MEDIQSEFERVNTQVAVAEKKLVTFDKVIELSLGVFFRKFHTLKKIQSEPQRQRRKIFDN